MKKEEFIGKWRVEIWGKGGITSIYPLADIGTCLNRINAYLAALPDHSGLVRISMFKKESPCPES